MDDGGSVNLGWQSRSWNKVFRAAKGEKLITLRGKGGTRHAGCSDDTWRLVVRRFGVAGEVSGTRSGREYCMGHWRLAMRGLSVKRESDAGLGMQDAQTE